MKIIGHRGARGLVEENTEDSLEAAIQHGVDEVEIDVRVTKDGIVVLSHDPFVWDGGGHKLVIATTDSSALFEAKPELVRLEVAILKVRRRVPLIIEIKPGEPIEAVVRIIQHYMKDKKYSNEDFLVASFDYRLLKAFRQRLPQIGVIVNERWSGIRATSRARRLRTRRIAMNQRWLWSGFISNMRRGNWLLSAYTLNDPNKVRRWQHDGLFGVITDNPDRFEDRLLK